MARPEGQESMAEVKPDSSGFNNFSEFYPHYLREHAQPNCRTLHYVGTTLTFVLVIIGLLVNPLWLAAIPLAGYGFAWVAHFFVEKNRPATFTHPFWSLLGDYKMYFSWLTGRLPQQLAAAGVANDFAPNP